MAPNELHLRILSLGWLYDSLLSGRNETSKLLNLSQKKQAASVLVFWNAFSGESKPLYEQYEYPDTAL